MVVGYSDQYPQVRGRKRVNMFDMLLNMLMAYIGTRALYENACDMMECATSREEFAYWRDERNDRRHEMNGQETLFESIGIPYVELFDAYLSYCDNPCEKQARTSCLILTHLVH